MCIIEPDIERIESTRIFARNDGYHQFLAYQMIFETEQPVAMILPVPVALPARDDSLRFVNLEGQQDLLWRLARTIPSPFVPAFFRTFGNQVDDVVTAQPLEVQHVGSYVATFVPSLADFDRVPREFRLPDAFWRDIARYQDWGFAVFQLQPHADPQEIEPMAFVFETRYPDRLFFPTLHRHDGNVAAWEYFDHILLAQGLELGPRPRLTREDVERYDRQKPYFSFWYPPENAEGWADTIKPLKAFDLALPDSLAGAIDAEEEVFLKVLRGNFPNEDHWAHVTNPGCRMSATGH